MVYLERSWIWRKHSNNTRNEFYGGRFEIGRVDVEGRKLNMERVVGN
jgi:hypothetical protein